MRRSRGLLAAVGLILATNLVVLGGVLFNRTGKPDAVLVLTERELPMAGRSREDTGVALDLSWEHLGAGYRSWETRWLDRGKLEALGFDCSVPESDPGADAVYRKALPRKAYVVLEQEGQAWEDFLLYKESELRSLEERVRRGEEPPERAEAARADLELAHAVQSRLFAVDAGRDAGLLRRKYPDRNRYLIAEGKVALVWSGHFWNAGKTGSGLESPHVWGDIQEISISRIHVPRGKADLLDALRKKDEAEAAAPGTALRVSLPWQGEREPRYRVRVSFGRRLEPWVEAIEPLVPAPQTGSGGKE